jgi:hypothetical protein
LGIIEPETELDHSLLTVLVVPKRDLAGQVDWILRDFPFVKIYIDDIIITSSNYSEHIVHTRTVLERH